MPPRADDEVRFIRRRTPLQGRDFRPFIGERGKVNHLMMEYLAENAIPTATCWELLRDAWLGRVALSVDALPMILPVEYYLDGEELAVCLGQYRLNDRAVNNAVVGFAADAVDTVTRAGWTVQIQGVARVHRPVGVALACGQAAAGQIVRIAPHAISGQRLQLCPFGTGLPSLAQPNPAPP
jgi:uncharacterized protein